MKRVFILLLLLFSISLTGCGETSYLEKTTAARESEPEKKESDTEEKETVDEIYVQIEGAVVNPGVYKLSADSRVFTLIEKAGGLKKDAASSEINQAELLTDGQKITILTKKDLKDRDKAGDTAASVTEASSENGKVDINRADPSQLTTISGIGPSKAEAIIAYREEHGPFRKTEDITKVSGIGDATYQKIKDKITV
ncbi:MAG: ComEA family DNA-binding protein [Lachnospiraceae bacterium]|nr:ComEA family DNA-binding protein [Lachnospiraceae bacterium]